MTPRFSIVIPTRDRPHLLRFALRSALAQGVPDVEIVVSDNTRDGTAREVVGEEAGSRARYVETGRDLPMPDSWEFALAQATGEHVLYLCDDDAFTPGLLAALSEMLDASPTGLITWSHARYHHPSWHQADLRNTVEVPAHTGAVTDEDSAGRLRALYRLDWRAYPPVLLNSMASRDVIDRVLAAGGRVFWPPAPDFSFAALSLSSTRSFLRVDVPLALIGAARESIGATGVYGDLEAVRAFAGEFESEVFSDVPLRVMTAANVISQTLVELQHRDLVAGNRLDWMAYFVMNWHHIQAWRRNGFDVGWALRHWEDTIRRYPSALGDDVRRTMRGQDRRRRIAGAIARVPLADRAVARLRGRPVPQYPKRMYRGTDLGFADIEECARRLPPLVAPVPGGVG